MSTESNSLANAINAANVANAPASSVPSSVPSSSTPSIAEAFSGITNAIEDGASSASKTISSVFSPAATTDATASTEPLTPEASLSNATLTNPSTNPSTDTFAATTDEYEVIPCNKVRKSKKKPICVKKHKETKPRTVKKVPVRMLKLIEQNKELKHINQQNNNKTKKIMAYVNKIGSMLSQ